MSALTIITLGTPSIALDGVLCPLASRKALALTLYLAVTGQAHPRVRLGALLWPEADEAHGLLNLRQALVRIRQVLGPAAPAHLRTIADRVRLDLGSGGQVDIALIAAATAPQASSEQQAVALRHYGGAFLTDLMLDDAPDFMDWVTAERVHWEACYDLIAERQMQQWLDEGRADEARTLGQTWISHRPDTEAGYRLLATAQATAGDVAGARLTLATAARQAAELGFTLTEQTHALSDHLATLTPSAPPPTTSRHIRLPFVGRQEAFTQLRRAYRQMQAGTPGMVLVQAESGLGKSRLVEAFVQWAQIQGADVAVGHAYELSGRLPYQPLMELLRQQIAREHAPDDLLEDSWLTELQRLVPDLHDRYPDLPAPLEDAAAGTRLLEAIAQVGIALAHRHPVVWVVEDMQWADAATGDALLFLVQRWHQEQIPALLVCTLRSDEIAATPPIAIWLATAQQLPALTYVTLTALGEDETTQTLTALLAGTAPPDLCAWLFATTQGNPLYLEHVVQALAERGIVQWQEETLRLVGVEALTTLEGWVPESLRALLLRRVRQHAVLTQQVLAAAAIVGARFREEVLVSVAGVDEQTVLAALESAERSLLLRAEGDRYGFTHDKVAEVLYADLTPARRRIFHRRALQALEGEGHVPPAELARHAIAAEAWIPAIAYTSQAGDAAERFGANQDAVRFYETLIQLLTTSPSQEVARQHFPDEVIADYYDRICLRLGIVGATAQARTLFTRLLAQEQTRGSQVIAGRLFMSLGRLALEHEHDLAAAQASLAAAQQIAEATGDVQGQLLALHHLSTVAWHLEALGDARNFIQQHVLLARTHRSPLYVAQNLNMLSDVEMWSGQWETACAAIEESTVICASRIEGFPPPLEYIWTTPLEWSGFFPRVASLAHAVSISTNHAAQQWGANGLAGMGMMRLHLGEGDVGRAALELAWQIFAEFHEWRFHHFYLLFRTWGWLETGAYEQALQEAQQIMDRSATAAEHRLDEGNVRSYCAMSDLHHALFQMDTARQSLDLAQAHATNRPIWDRLLPAARWCTHHALSGNWNAAYEAALQAQSLREAWGSPLPWFDFARYHETEALVRAGERERAEADARRLGEHLGNNRRYRLVWLRMQAVLERDAGDHVAALTHLKEAYELAAQMKLPGEAWQIAAEQVASCTAMGDLDLAQAAYQQAEVGIQTLAAHITDGALHDHFTDAALSRLPAPSTTSYVHIAALSHADQGEITPQ